MGLGAGVFAGPADPLVEHYRVLIAQVVQAFEQYSKDVAACRTVKFLLSEAGDAYTPSPAPAGKGCAGG